MYNEKILQWLLRVYTKQFFLCNCTSIYNYTFIVYTFYIYLLFSHTGLDGVSDFLRQYSEIFSDAGSGRFALCTGVVVPRVRDIPAVHEDYSVHDTPPGQKVTHTETLLFYLLFTAWLVVTLPSEL